jgi:tungstate transport system permease protein
MDLIWQGLLDALRLLATRDPATLRIAALSLAISGVATLIAAIGGLPLGLALALRRFPGRRLLTGLVTTGMGLPPVVVGLVVALLLARGGPFGALGLLYTPAAMIVAQTTVALPLAAGLTRGAISGTDPDLLGALRADGAREWRVAWEIARSVRAQLVVAVAAAFGRAISEVGASQIVGGNIIGQTRIMTTAIALETNRGEFARAIALGLILLALAFVVNTGLARAARLAPTG